MEIDLHAIKSVVYCYLLLHRRSKELESRGELAFKGQKLRPKAESRSGLLGVGRTGSKRFFGHIISLKCIQAPFMGLNFICFIAQICNYRLQRATFDIFGGRAWLLPLHTPRPQLQLSLES